MLHDCDKMKNVFLSKLLFGDGEEKAADNAIVLAQISAHISGFYPGITVEACAVRERKRGRECVCVRVHMCRFLQGKQILDIL